MAITNHYLKTQMERAKGGLGVAPVFALSPQAKGRGERLLKTLQDVLHGNSRASMAHACIERENLPAREGTAHGDIVSVDRLTHFWRRAFFRPSTRGTPFLPAQRGTDTAGLACTSCAAPGDPLPHGVSSVHGRLHGVLPEEVTSAPADAGPRVFID